MSTSPIPPVLDQDRYAVYQPTAATTDFALGFPLFGEASDVTVYLDGNELALTTDYTVRSTANGASLTPAPVSDAYVRLSNPISAGVLEIFGNFRPRRTIQASAPYGTRDFNFAFSLLMSALREMWSKFTRAIKVPVGEAELTIPTSTDRAGQVLAFDAAGKPVAGGSFSTIVASAASASAAAANASASAQSAANSAAAAQTWDPNNYYSKSQTDKIAAIKAGKRNRHLNPAFQVCQDRATGATIVIGNSQAYVFDGAYVVANNTGALSCSQVAKASPGGSPYRLRCVVSTADTAIAASDTYSVSFPIEGIDVADLLFGTANAKAFVWRGVVNLPAGTYGLSFCNGSGSRSYVVPFTIANGAIDTLISAVVPGDTSGTWVADSSGVGIYARISLASGITWQTATPSAWVAGNLLATAAQTNLMATVGNVAEFADLGFYEGAELPTWEMPSYADDLAECKRYYESIPIGTTAYTAWAGGAGGSTTSSIPFKVSKRVAPSHNLVPTTYNCGALVYPTADNLILVYTSSASGLYYWYSSSGTVTINARP